MTVKLYIASTGPHSEECGEPSVQPNASSRQSRFNGAALRRVRRAQCIGVGGGRGAGFNGAALRRVRRGYNPRGPTFPRLASTGPHSEECGERGRPRLKLTTRNGFNGAALRRVRRDGGTIKSSGLTASLQRGRTPKSAERAGSRSMPVPRRSLQRGRTPKSAERSGSPRIPARSCLLQRGRTPKSAERRRPTPASSRSSPLQRGRTPKSAESFRLLGINQPSHPASTGPHSEECGEGNTFEKIEINVKLASTGPHSEECGEAQACRRARRADRSFNGAALRRVRRARSFGGTYQ